MKGKNRHSSKQYAVIGIGRFGESLIKELIHMGHEVLAIDIDEEKVDDIKDIATHAVVADSKDEHTLISLGLKNFDAVIVAIGHNLEVNILTTLLLKEIGVKKVISKAQNYWHGKVLEKIGTDLVTYPERDMAIKLAHSLHYQNFKEKIALSDIHSLVELSVPAKFIGKTIAQLELRKKFGINIAIIKSDQLIVSPEPDYMFKENDLLVVVGENKDIEILTDL